MPDGRFDGQNAKAHVERLAGAIGSRAAGTNANLQARAYLIETLQLYGFDVRVQEAEAEWRERGVTARVANVIAIRNGRQADAIGIAAHYDSVTAGPGAGDDGFGVAVALEAARVLAARPAPRYSLMILLTDAEEDGLMGARALVQDAEVRARLRTYLNVEAIGTRGPVALFETGPGTGAALRAWTAAPRPRGGSFMLPIYKALPNDTDATIFRELEIAGLNFAAVGDSHAYHTDRDRPDRVDAGALASAGENVVAIVDRLDTATLDASPDAPVFFSVLDRVAFLMTTRAASVLAVAAVVLGLLAWVLLMRAVLRVHGVLPLVLTFAWATLATGAVAVTLWGSVWLLRVARAQLHPWNAYPWRLFLYMTVMVVAVTWLVRRVAAALPPGLRPLGTPAAVWITALPVWMALCVASLVYAVGASYLVSVPLALTALLLLPASFGRPSLLRVVSAVSVLIVWSLWAADAWTLLNFAVAILARLPLVTPIWLFPVAFMGIGLFLWPPVIAVLVGRPTLRIRHGLAASVLMIVVVIAAALVLLAPAYSAEQPQRRSATFVDDRITGEAYWRLTGNEPGVDIGAGPTNVQWHPVEASASAGPWLSAGAFVFEGRVEAPAHDDLPRVTSLVTRRDEGADIEVTIAAHSFDRLSTAFVLPESVVPTQTSLPGRTSYGHWRATHVNVPREGLTWRATVPAGQGPSLDETSVWFAHPGVPGGDATGLPAWLSRERTAWNAMTLTMVPTTPDEVLGPVESDLGESRFAPTPQGRVHYFDSGSGDAALVFLHGWGGRAEQWREQRPLATGHRALFLDLPGHGRSDVSESRHTIAAMADAVQATLQSAGVSRAVVVGHSMGALVGWHLALKDPNRVEGLVSVDGALLPFQTDPAQARNLVDTIDQLDMRAFIDSMLPRLFTASSPPAIRDEVVAQMRQTTPRVLAEAMADMSTAAGPPFAPGVLQKPTLALVAVSPSTPTDQEARLREFFPALDYRAFPDAGHYLMLERPRDVNDAIAGFILGRGLLR